MLEGLSLKLKTFFFLLLLLFFFQCSRFTYETTYRLRPEEAVTVEDEWRTLLSKSKKPPKIVLVGFKGYKIGKSVTGLRTSEYFAELDYEQSSSLFFKNGQSIDLFQEEKKTVSADRKNIERFVIEYLKVTESSGKKEIEKLFVPSKSGDKYLMRKIDADYIVLALHSPYYHERTKSPINSITGFFGILTLGTIPIYEESAAESSFLVFDSKLNYLSTFYYKRDYLIRSAWWMWPNEGFQTFFTQQETPPINAYKIHVEEFEREFLRSLASDKPTKK